MSIAIMVNIIATDCLNPQKRLPGSFSREVISTEKQFFLEKYLQLPKDYVSCYLLNVLSHGVTVHVWG